MLQVGPRMELEIVKAEEGMCAGQVLYHQHITKSDAEVQAQSEQIRSAEELREKRRKEQVSLNLSFCRPTHPDRIVLDQHAFALRH